MEFQPDDYEWDGGKAAGNLDKHQIDFAAIRTFDWRTAAVEENPRYGELRYCAFGYIGDRLHTVIFTLRNDKCRIISLRKSNSREMLKYAQIRAQA